MLPPVTDSCDDRRPNIPATIIGAGAERSKPAARQGRTSSTVFDRVRDELDDLSKIEQDAKLEGKQMVMVIAPR